MTFNRTILILLTTALAGSAFGVIHAQSSIQPPLIAERARTPTEDWQDMSLSSDGLVGSHGLAAQPQDDDDLGSQLQQLRETIQSLEEKIATLETAQSKPSASPAKPADAKTDYYVDARSVGTKRESEPPRYVRNLSKLEDPRFADIKWLDVGLDYRMRYEYRDDDFRRAVAVLDQPFLLRTRAYLGLREIVDPFRFGVEFEDAQRENGLFPLDNRDVNQYEFIQLFGELYFKDFFGTDRPFRLQGGRLAMEYVDRRLVARNEWRNTTNNFQGFRAILGQQKNDWQLDLFALRPMERLLSQPDRVDENRWFLGAVGDWRRWSEIVTLQPYYLILTQEADAVRVRREIHTMAIRGYGNIGESGWDYDGDVALQYGRHGTELHRAFGFTSELGYTWCHPWKVRTCAFVGYGSGDRNPTDNKNHRFDRLFGFARPWSANDYFLWENLIAPKLRIDLEPIKDVRIDGGYGTFWLASATDSWANANLRDPTGTSGSFIGQEFDVRVRLKPTRRIDMTLGYAHFIPGKFTRNTSRSEDSDFFYVETSIRAFK